MPKPDKTKLDKWNFDVHHKVIESETYATKADLPESVKALIDIDNTHNLIVQHNNTPAFIEVEASLKSQGVIITDIQTAVAEHSDLVEKYYMTDAVKVDEHRLTALHAAMMNGGVFIYVPRNVVIEHPVQYIVLHDNEEANLFNHVVIVADESSEVTYVENYLSGVTAAKVSLTSFQKLSLKITRK